MSENVIEADPDVLVIVTSFGVHYIGMCSSDEKGELDRVSGQHATLKDAGIIGAVDMQFSKENGELNILRQPTMAGIGFNKGPVKVFKCKPTGYCECTVQNLGPAAHVRLQTAYAEFCSRNMADVTERITPASKIPGAGKREAEFLKSMNRRSK